MTADRLDSWKEIAAYLKRSVRTVTRWEREEGLPVHRHLHSKSGTVYAFKPELDGWWTSRGQQLDDQPAAREPAATHNRSPWLFVFAAIAVLVVAVVAWLAAARRPTPVTAKLVPLTTYPGTEGPPSLSPDGNQVTFERDGDIFVKQVDGEALVQLTKTGTAEYSPAWSPDGRQIAFIRAGEALFVISPLGGGERKIADTRTPLLLRSIAWSPDSRQIVVSEMTSPIAASLVAISMATGERTRLTSPPEPSIGDGWPAVSPDGNTVAFARYSQDTSANINIVPFKGGEPRQLTADKASIFGIAWTTNGEVLFSSDRDGTSRLWRISIEASQASTALDVAGDGARFPSIAHPAGSAPRLAFQRFSQNFDIRRAEIVGGAAARQQLTPSQSFIASTKSDDHPRYSPDGSRIAFVSRRSGSDEVWVCDSDGTDPVRLTSMGGPLVLGPQWSPDGRRIAFFAATGHVGKYVIYVIDAQGGQPARLTQNENELQALPAWSRDGKSMYVASGRSGSLQIWKAPIGGGGSIQLTRHGGAEAAEAPDGRSIYYTRVPETGPGLWRVPVEGGEERLVLPSVRFGYWALSQAGIYFVDFDVARDGLRRLKFFSFQSQQTTDIGAIENSVSWTNTPGFAISPDGRWLLYTSLESTDADLMLVENFR
jgi:Tol biopolymer transport system component